VINLRGAVLPIIDLATRLGMPSTEPTARNVIIVVQLFHRQVGILVDAVSDILTANDNVVQPLPDVTSGLVKSFVKGLLPMDGRMVSLIALDHVLPPDELDVA
jgi:purine-binding chemotaxis protein CheW